MVFDQAAGAFFAFDGFALFLLALIFDVDVFEGEDLDGDVAHGGADALDDAVDEVVACHRGDGDDEAADGADQRFPDAAGELRGIDARAGFGEFGEGGDHADDGAEQAQQRADGGGHFEAAHVGFEIAQLAGADAGNFRLAAFHGDFAVHDAEHRDAHDAGDGAIFAGEHGAGIRQLAAFDETHDAVDKAGVEDAAGDELVGFENVDAKHVDRQNDDHVHDEAAFDENNIDHWIAAGFYC